MQYDRIRGADDQAQSPQEAEQTQALIKCLHDFMQARDAAQAVQRRDLHTKTLGLLRAEFTVLPDLPADLRLGLFAQPATYKAWVRLSNSAQTIEKDGRADIRGMAIKLMGVPGSQVLQADAATHDFLLVNAPVFAPATVGGVRQLVAAVVGGMVTKISYLITQPSVAWFLLTSMRQCADLFQERYFSCVTYAFGEQAVKYIATPRPAPNGDMPAPAGSVDLRQRAAQRLANGDTVFDFGLQFQRDEASMPVDDSTREWSLALSPPRRVAELRILPQVFDTPEIDTYGENLSFNPWHALPEHQPLGGIGRARRAVYVALSTFRREKNDAPLREPADWEV